jgi:hypothetical protein
MTALKTSLPDPGSAFGPAGMTGMFKPPDRLPA